MKHKKCACCGEYRCIVQGLACQTGELRALSDDDVIDAIEPYDFDTFVVRVRMFFEKVHWFLFSPGSGSVWKHGLMFKLRLWRTFG